MNNRIIRKLIRESGFVGSTVEADKITTVVIDKIKSILLNAMDDDRDGILDSHTLDLMLFEINDEFGLENS